MFSYVTPSCSHLPSDPEVSEAGTSSGDCELLVLPGTGSMPVGVAGEVDVFGLAVTATESLVLMHSLPETSPVVGQNEPPAAVAAPILDVSGDSEHPIAKVPCMEMEGLPLAGSPAPLLLAGQRPPWGRR